MVAQLGSLQGPRARIGRQAIFDRLDRVWAYELKYHAGDSPALRGDLAASDVILNAFVEWGLERAVTNATALISATRATMTGDLPLPVPPTRVVLQLDAGSLGSDQRLHAAVRARHEQGFRLALDDFTTDHLQHPWLLFADFLKVDVDVVGIDAIPQFVKTAKLSAAELIVKNVGSAAAMVQCRKLGAHHFQGDFLLKAQVLTRRRTPRNFAVLAELMSKVRQESVRFDEIEDVIQRDAGLVVMLLRFLNSAGYGLKMQVSSIRQAVALLGLEEFSKWVMLLALASSNDKPSELLVTALVRAKTCEELSRHSTHGGNATLAFLAGLFSVLDAMLDQPLEDILGDLPIPDVLRYALLEHAGSEGELLACVLNHERGQLPDDLIVAPDILADSWLHAVEWADKIGASALR